MRFSFTLTTSEKFKSTTQSKFSLIEFLNIVQFSGCDEEFQRLTLSKQIQTNAEILFPPRFSNEIQHKHGDFWRSQDPTQNAFSFTGSKIQGRAFGHTGVNYSKSFHHGKVYVALRQKRSSFDS